jgi:DNA end-binding protein Ku
MKAIWKGHITFGLISIPIGLYGAVESSEQVGFRLLHKKDHAPIKYKKFCSLEDIEVSNNEIVRSYEVEKNRFVVVEAKELEEVQEKVADGDRTIEIVQCVDLSSINPLLFEKPYYLAPEKGGNKAYVVLREALRDAKRVGITRFFMRTRPLLAALIPGQQVLSLEVLRSFEELRTCRSLTKRPSRPRSSWHVC